MAKSNELIKMQESLQKTNEEAAAAASSASSLGTIPTGGSQIADDKKHWYHDISGKKIKVKDEDADKSQFTKEIIMSKSLEYQKFCESVNEAANNFGFMIKKFDFVPRRNLDQILLEGGRRADSKLIETTLNQLNSKQDWAFVGIEHETPKSIQQAAIVYDYLEKSYKFVHGDGSLQNVGTWTEALFMAHNLFSPSDKVWLLDSHRKMRLSNTTKANILVSRR